MDLLFLFKVLQITTALLLVLAILLQQSESNVGGAFGGGSVEDQSVTKRRGGTKVLFIATFVLTALFIGSIIAPLFL